MAGPALTFAIPSKGRLQEQVTNYLGDAGIVLKQVTGARDYRATIKGEPSIDVKLMSSAEIASALGTGEIHFGVTGEDLIRESVPDADQRIALLQPLSVGHADASSSMMIRCSVLASSEPVPPRPVVHRARSDAVDPLSLRRRGSAPAPSSVSTALEHRFRTAR